MNMNKNNRNKRDKMDDKAFIRAITRFRNGDQYLKGVKVNILNVFQRKYFIFSMAPFLKKICTLKNLLGHFENT